MPEERQLRIGVLALQGAFALHADRLRELGADVRLVRKPEELDGIDGLIIPGGESSTFLKFLERGNLLGSLKEFISNKPAFGTCAGAILLAEHVTHPAQESLGAMHITVERNSYGRQNDSTILTGETSLPGGPLEMVFIRAPKITATGAGVEVLAMREGSPTLVREGKLLAATFHPELSSDTRVHEEFLRIVDASREASPAAK